MSTILKYQNGLLVPVQERLPANQFDGPQPFRTQVKQADRITSGRIGRFAKAVIAIHALLTLAWFLLVA